MLLLWDFMKHLLVLLGMNSLVSTRIQPIIPSVIEYFRSFINTIFNVDLFKCKNEVMGDFNENNLLWSKFEKFAAVLQKACQ